MSVIKRKNVPEKKTDEKTVPLRFGPLPQIPGQKVWVRSVVIGAVLVFVWYSSKPFKEISLAKQKDVLVRRGQDIACDPDYIDEIKHFPACVPSKCGRHVSDKLVTNNEVEILLNMAKKGIALGGSSGGASILDLHSGALSHGAEFKNIYSLEQAKRVINPSSLAVYKIAKSKIQHAIAENFGINSDSLFLTKPTFFSKLSNDEPKSIHDEYWHLHIDKVTYEAFHYTSLLYLTDYNVDFKGGRLVFNDNIDKPRQNVTIEPRRGRVLMFTSGAENPHFVERVTEGTRYAITVSFTCDKSKAIKDLGV